MERSRERKHSRTVGRGPEAAPEASLADTPVLGVMLGTLLGVGMAALLAPEKGKERREKLFAVSRKTYAMIAPKALALVHWLGEVRKRRRSRREAKRNRLVPRAPRVLGTAGAGAPPGGDSQGAPPAVQKAMGHNRPVSRGRPTDEVVTPN